MSPERFNKLDKLVSPHLVDGSNLRRADVITKREKLAVTIRYLASGESQQSMVFNFRLGKSTVSQILREVCKAIWSALSEIYLKPPTTCDQFKRIAEGFEAQWNFPHVLGAVDGKHIRIEKPAHAGSLHYNHKGYHSTVWMAMCDANYAFTHVDIGSYGKECDNSVFAKTAIYQALNSGTADVP